MHNIVLHTHAHAHTHKHSHTHAHTHKHSHTHSHTHALTHTLTHTHTGEPMELDVRLNFSQPATTRGEVKDRVVEMSRKARGA